MLVNMVLLWKNIVVSSYRDEDRCVWMILRKRRKVFENTGDIAMNPGSRLGLKLEALQTVEEKIGSLGLKPEALQTVEENIHSGIGEEMSLQMYFCNGGLHNVLCYIWKLYSYELGFHRK